MGDIFNLSYVGDLPEVLRKQLKSTTENRPLSVDVLPIIQQANTSLSVDQIQVAFFRLHNIVLKRDKLRTCLNNLCRSGKIKKHNNLFEFNYEK